MQTLNNLRGKLSKTNMTLSKKLSRKLFTRGSEARKLFSYILKFPILPWSRFSRGTQNDSIYFFFFFIFLLFFIFFKLKIFESSRPELTNSGFCLFEPDLIKLEA